MLLPFKRSVKSNVDTRIFLKRLLLQLLFQFVLFQPWLAQVEYIPDINLDELKKIAESTMKETSK